MKKSLSSISFLSGIVVIILSLILIFVINKAVGIATNVLIPLGAFLLLLGSFLPDKK